MLDGKVYALKRYDAHDMKSLMKEVQVLRRLSHPYITEVSFLVVNEVHKTCYQVMPFYEGGSLQALIGEGAFYISLHPSQKTANVQTHIAFHALTNAVTHSHPHR